MPAEERDDLCQTLKLKLIGIAREKRIHHLMVRRVLCNCARDFWRVWNRNQSRTVYGEEGGLFATMPAPEAEPDAAEEARRTTDTLIDILPDFQQKLIRLHFGLDGRAIKNMALLGKAVGLSESAAEAELQAALEFMRSQAKGI